MNRLFAALLLLCAISCGTAHAAAPIVFSDGEFNDTDWEIFSIMSGNGGAYSSTHIAMAGNPGSFRRTSISLNAAPGPLWTSKVSIIDLFDGAIYDPSTQGAITSISYREDAIWLSGPPSLAFRTGVALRQNSKVYIVRIGNTVTGTETIWHPETAAWIESDFIELDAADMVNGFNDLSFPDFTTGGPIEIGFFRTRTTNPGGGAVAEVISGIDNWNVTINRVPEPGALTLASLGLAAGLLGWRRKRLERDKGSE